MSRFLFVVPPLAGHVNPAFSVGCALAERGHEVAWTGSERLLRPMLGPDAVVYPTGMRPFRGQGDLGAAAVKSLWEGFAVPLARFTMPALDKAVTQYQPDVLVADQHAFAGPIVAHRHGLPWASLAPSSLELARPYQALPKVDAWMRGQMEALWAGAGLPPGEYRDLRFSPYLVLAFTTAALAGTAAYPRHFALVGPAIADRPAPGFPWERLDPGRRHVLVTVGTVAIDISDDFYTRAVAALRPVADRLQAIMVTLPEALPGVPDDVIVTARVPLLSLLPQLDVVVCHAGLGTVCETLTHGVPLVVAPVGRDQPITAAQVVAAGAAVRVKYGRVSPDQLREAVLTVLGDPAYRTAAARLRDSFTAAGGARAAAQRLEDLVPRVGFEPTLHGV
jgi:zeaxanthin glucosyltransferase